MSAFADLEGKVAVVTGGASGIGKGIAEALENEGVELVIVDIAGIGPMGRIADLTLDDWKWMVGVNLWGVIHGIHAFLPILKGNEEGGHIVNTSSMAGLVGMPG